MFPAMSKGEDTMETRCTRATFWSTVVLLALSPAISQAQLGYQQANLVTDGGDPNIQAAHTDSELVNPWGLVFLPGSPWWISDNHSGKSTLYNGDGTPRSLVVSIPGEGSPTGIVATLSGDFSGDRFIFASEDGTISGWQPSLGTTAANRVLASEDNIYKGLALANNGSGNFLYAANFKTGNIDVFDKNYAPALGFGGKFVDPNAPAGYAPFGIQNIGGNIYVTYAKQNGEDDAPGPGNGFVDEYDANGNLLRRFATGSSVGGTLDVLNSPWGLAAAPGDFGKLSGDLLVGNFGSGQIAAFKPDGTFDGLLSRPDG